MFVVCSLGKVFKYYIIVFFHTFLAQWFFTFGSSFELCCAEFCVIWRTLFVPFELQNWHLALKKLNDEMKVVKLTMDVSDYHGSFN